VPEHIHPDLEVPAQEPHESPAQEPDGS